ncbi:MAG: MBL fold metallo-hydrolase [Acidobacteriota bacterium]
MKKWLFRIAIFMASAVVLLVLLLFWIEMGSTSIIGYIKNESLPVIKENWPGNAIDQRGRFVNDEFPFIPKFTSLLKWKLNSNPFAEEKKADTARVAVLDPTEFLESDRDGVVWLGHASFLIRLDGVSYLTDPIFGKPPLMRTYVDVPTPIAKIRRVDYVLLSHDHRDHTDENSLRAVAAKFPDAVFLGGLGMDDLFSDWAAGHPSQTAGWFQRYEMPAGKPGIYFLPVRHWARRGLLDMNRRLWGSFILQGRSATVYFGGDSGFGRHYREVGELFPKIDYFLIGIGAFEPRWFMEPHHNNPDDAVKAFHDSGARTLIPMHYGTFDLSDEPPGAPLRQLLQIAWAEGIGKRIRPLAINESLNIE